MRILREALGRVLIGGAIAGIGWQFTIRLWLAGDRFMSAATFLLAAACYAWWWRRAAKLPAGQSS